MKICYSQMPKNSWKKYGEFEISRKTKTNDNSKYKTHCHRQKSTLNMIISCICKYKRMVP